jgi:hypothetical protein
MMSDDKIGRKTERKDERQKERGQPLYNANQVITCLNYVLVECIVKAGTTGSLTLRNNTNRTVTARLNETFINNATNTLDSCIIPIRG